MADGDSLLLESDVPTVALQTTRRVLNGVRATPRGRRVRSTSRRLHTSVRHRNRPIPSRRTSTTRPPSLRARVRALDRESDDRGSRLSELSRLSTRVSSSSSHTNLPVSNTFIISDDVENVWAPLLSAAAASPPRSAPRSWTGSGRKCF